jgi:hypothetical protein
MNAYYFTVSIYKRKVLQKVITINDLHRLARFILDSEDHRREKFKEGFVRIEKCYAGMGTNCNVLLEQFDADRLDGLTVKALKANR